MMNRTIAVLLVVACAASGRALAEADAGSQSQEPGGKQIVARITSFETAADHLELRYEIRNNSAEEIWICDDMDAESPLDFETVACPDGYVLFIRLRLGMPCGWWRLLPPDAKYVRIMSGECYASSIRLALPIRQQPILSGRSAHRPEKISRARRVVLEVGYFRGDLAGRVAVLARELETVGEAWLAQGGDAHLETKLGENRKLLLKRMNEAASSDERQRMQEELDELDAACRQVLQHSMCGSSISAYSETLDMEIPFALFGHLGDKAPDGTKCKSELVIPYSYSEFIERERFLKVTLDDVTIPHLPPRYLDLTQGIPWKKERLDTRREADFANKR
jgi:hypothetical protein